jgi:2,3,4,5-tetrahydropyridine-2-carboxylate N-succinyltransferase
MKEIIERAFQDFSLLEKPETKSAVLEAIQLLDEGQRRVCEKQNEQWQVHEWLKQAILLFFRVQEMKIMKAGDFDFYDKIPVKKWTGKEGVRVVPQAIARFGSFIEPGCILMPSYVNVGAYVGAGSMVDTWATVGSCAQIGKNVHLSGGVGIGGVLEPVQAKPVIIEDHCFIGSRAIIVEGVHIEESAVIGAGVTLTASTPIIDVRSSPEKVFKSRVPARSVVIPGARVKKFPAGDYQVPCALIIGERNESTDKKTSLTSVLRDFEVAV